MISDIPPPMQPCIISLLCEITQQANHHWLMSLYEQALVWGKEKERERGIGGEKEKARAARV